MNSITESCSCDTVYPILLQYDLTENPFACLNCNLSRALEISDSLRREVDVWLKHYKEVYKDWLEYDKGLDVLCNPLSDINEMGLAITKKLNAIIPTYYRLHKNEIYHYTDCPKCDLKMGEGKNSYSTAHKVCEECRIVVS